MATPQTLTYYQTSTEPTKLKALGYKIFFKLFGFIGRLYLKRFFTDIKISGEENLKGGPKLVLMNHSCPLDPLLITFFGGRPLQWLITEAFMQKKIPGKLASFFGQIAKRKIDFDTTPIQLMKKWSECGLNVATFPEGRFSWDGTPSPLLPGLDHLVKYLDLPVVIVTLKGGHRVKPAWAQRYRRTAIEIRIGSPRHFSSKDQITETIKNSLFPSEFLRGQEDFSQSALALGLSQHLRFCPGCGSDQSLSDRDNEIHCHYCNESWEVTLENHLKGKNQSLSISEAFSRSYQQIEKRFSEETFQFSSIGEVELIDMAPKKWQKILTGQLIITNKGIQIGKQFIPSAKIYAFCLEWGDLIVIKTRLDRFALRMESDGRPCFIKAIEKITGKYASV